MKQIILKASMVFFTLALIVHWFAGSIGIAIIATILGGGLICFANYLRKRNSKWWITILMLFISLTFLSSAFSNVTYNLLKKQHIVINGVEKESTESVDDEVKEEDNIEDEISEEPLEELNDVEDETSDEEDDVKYIEKVVKVPVEKVVEKTIEVPVEKVVEKTVEVPVEKEVEKIVEVPVEKVVEKIVEVPVEKVVEKIVEVPVEAPQKENKPSSTAPNSGYYGDPTGNNYGNNYGFTGDPTGGRNNTSLRISGETKVTAGKTYTYTIQGVNSISEDKFDLPDNITIKRISGNKVELLFEKGWTGTFSIGYRSVTINVKVSA